MLEELTHQLKESDCSCYRYLYFFAVVIGAYKLAIFLYYSVKWVQRHTFRQKMNLLERYGGKGTWALVTGASDGFGAEYCRQLAKDGFNIILVSRTMSKLQAVDQELKQINPSIQTRIVQADFSGNATVEFYKNIFEKVKDLDIGLLINNAGVMFNGRVDESKEKYLTDTIDVNVTHVAMMTSHFLPKLLARKPKRSGLINVSSMIGYFDGSAGMAVYGASKAYVNFFTQALAKEVEGQNIDVQCFTPGMAGTNLWQEKSKNNVLGITPKSCVTAGLRDMGFGLESSGHWNHDLQTPFVEFMSQLPGVQFVFNIVYGKWMKS